MMLTRTAVISMIRFSGSATTVVQFLVTAPGLICLSSGHAGQFIHGLVVKAGRLPTTKEIVDA